MKKNNDTKKITQNNWNFWTVNLIMRAKKLLTSRQIFQYAVPARTVTKKALVISLYVCARMHSGAGEYSGWTMFF